MKGTGLRNTTGYRIVAVAVSTALVASLPAALPAQAAPPGSVAPRVQQDRVVPGRTVGPARLQASSPLKKLAAAPPIWPTDATATVALGAAGSPAAQAAPVPPGAGPVTV